MSKSLQRKTIPDPFCQPLENRLHLDATLTNGLLMATGTSDNDTIAVSLLHEGSAPHVKPAQIQVNINGVITTFNLTSISRIELHGLEGNDHLLVNESGAPFPLKVFMYGEAGDDVLTG